MSEWNAIDGIRSRAPVTEDVPNESQPATTTSPRGLRAPEVAARLGVSIRTLEDWRRKRRGPPFVRVGPRAIVYPEADLNAWLSDRRVG